MDYLLQEEHFSVRKAEVSDAALIAELIQALAEYEKAGKAALSKRLETTLTYCLANLAAAYDLLEISEQDGVLRNILFDGVRQAQAGVLKTEDEHGSI